MDGDKSSYGCLDCGEISVGDGFRCQHCYSPNVTSNLQAARRVKEEKLNPKVQTVPA